MSRIYVTIINGTTYYVGPIEDNAKLACQMANGKPCCIEVWENETQLSIRQIS